MGESGGPLGSAYITPSEPIIGPDGKYYVPLYYHFPVGRGGSITESSVLVKPFTRLIEEGNYVGKIAFVFYRQDNSYFILGSFAFTDRGRIVFFPGFTFTFFIMTRFLHGMKDIPVLHARSIPFSQ